MMGQGYVHDMGIALQCDILCCVVCTASCMCGGITCSHTQQVGWWCLNKYAALSEEIVSEDAIRRLEYITIILFATSRVSEISLGQRSVSMHHTVQCTLVSIIIYDIAMTTTSPTHTTTTLCNCTISSDYTYVSKFCTVMVWGWGWWGPLPGMYRIHTSWRVPKSSVRRQWLKSVAPRVPHLLQFLMVSQTCYKHT